MRAGVVLAAVCFSMASVAHAQPDAPDVVVLRAGGVVRGTISEAIPDESVVIVGAEGVRVIDWADVAYAGPASDAPAASSTAPRLPPPPPASPLPRAPEATLDAAHVRLYLTSVPTGVWVYARAHGLALRRAERYRLPVMRAWREGLVPICVTPCTAVLPRGRVGFGLEIDDVVVDGDDIVLEGPAQVGVRHLGRGPTRAGIIGIGVMLIVTGGVLSGAGLFEGAGDAWGAGMLMGLLGVIVTTAGALLGDDVALTVRR
jgi:hypothetical protein